MNAVRRVARTWLALLVLAVLSTGCVTPSYWYGEKLVTQNDYPLPPGEEQIERGRPNAVLDGVGWVVGIPNKLILWNRKIDNHDVSSETETVLRNYLAKNDLQHVKVRINQYDPLGEWERLFRARQVGAGWRATFGTLSMLSYTLLPGRVFGGDNYNPFTNTISIYSDHPGVVLHEGGHAKDFAEHEWKGTYAALYLLPGGALALEANATTDALSYLEAEELYDLQAEAYKVLYPAYGTYVGSTVNGIYAGPYGAAVTLGSVVPGHILGRMKARDSEAKQHAYERRQEELAQRREAESSGVVHAGFFQPQELDHHYEPGFQLAK